MMKKKAMFEEEDMVDEDEDEDDFWNEKRLWVKEKC